MDDYKTKKPVLLNSLNRDELIAAHICIACRREVAMPRLIYGKLCNILMGRADRPRRIADDTKALVRRVEP